MRKKLAYDLALIFTREQFREYFSGLDLSDKKNYTKQMERMYLFFEEAYIYCLLMEPKNFDFSDVE